MALAIVPRAQSFSCAILFLMKDEQSSDHSLDRSKKAETFEFEFELNFYQSLYKKLPNDKRVIALLAELYTRKGSYDAGLELDQKLVAMEPKDPIAHYNLACSLALKLELTESLERLKESIRLGFKELTWILEDPDLANLRETKAFLAYKHELGIQ